MRLSAFAFASTVIATILASCSGGSSQTPTSAPTTEAVDPIAALTPPPRLQFTTGALLQHHGRLEGAVTIGSRAGDSVLVPLDARTGEPLPARDPLLLRYATDPVVSPDGQTLAFVNGESDIPEVQLVKLDPATAAAPRLADPISWPDEVDPGFALNLSALRWSTDGQHLYWLRSQHELWTLDIATHEGRRLATLEGAGWGSPLVSPDGRTIYALRRPCCDPATDGDAYVIAVNASTGAEVGRTSLPGVTSNPPGSRFELAPVVAFSPDGSRIYVVHADTDLVTTVMTDPLAAGAPQPIQPSAEVLESGFVSRAGVDRLLHRTIDARVSPDGRWLYVTGADTIGCDDDPFSSSCITGDPLGLQVLDVTSMTLIHHQPGIEEFSISPDGRWLVATGSVERWDNAAQAMVTQGFGLTILEADTGRLAASLESGETIDQVAVSPDSRYLYYVTAIEEPGCSSCTSLTVFDLERSEVVAERSLGPRPVGLVSVAPGP